MIDHLAIQCADVAAGAGFYDTVLAPLGGRLILDFGEVIGFGVPPVPDFWLNPVSRAEGRSGPGKTGDGFREAHITFAAPDRAAVRAFYEAAVAGGRRGAPRTP